MFLNCLAFQKRIMECWDNTIFSLSWTLIVGGVAYLLHQRKNHTQYGRYAPVSGYCCPARLGWFLQEVPSFMLPLLLLFTEDAQKSGNKIGRTLLVCTFMLHYFHRSFIYAFLTRGRPMPMPIVAYAAIFCSVNGFLQGHHLLHCAQFDLSWLTVSRMTAGSLLFVVGLTINIHSDHILRTLRKPGETVYRIPYGGMFEFVSGANFFGEILEWCGYAIASWSFPTFAFAFFTICSIGPRACQHHRDYQQRFDEYPRCRKALIPFLL